MHIRALNFNMATKRKTTTKGVTTRSMRKMKPANDITEIKRPSPKPSLTPTSAVTWNSIPYHIK